MLSIEIKSQVDFATTMKISQVKLVVCLVLPFLASVYPTFYVPPLPPKKCKKCFLSTFLTTYMLDTEIIISGNFLSSQISKFSGFCPAQSHDFEISNFFTSYNFCPLQSVTGNCLTPLLQSVPVHSLQGTFLHILCLAVPVTI